MLAGPVVNTATAENSMHALPVLHGCEYLEPHADVQVLQMLFSCKLCVLQSAGVPDAATAALFCNLNPKATP